MIQQLFAQHATEILKSDEFVIGLAVGGSWLSNEIDEFSDLDLILVTREKVSTDKSKMLQYANRLGDLISAFTGEHVGEPRVLICLYDKPLLHVDIKFVTLDEFASRVENPILLIDRDNQLQKILDQTEAKFPYPDYQWIEDRFWTWMHYALLKIGRGEYLEALDFFGFLRMVVFGPLLHIKNKNLPRGVRKVESQLPAEDFNLLKGTIAEYNKIALITALENAIVLYKNLRIDLYTENIRQNKKAEDAVIQYLAKIKR
ncbi:nucleotidyltransferase domain-containing protein [Pedobacter sp. SG908]|uniref:nucleotidyltransferase domain-containing protein n=1 Tax=Pedobacter sp. SG908 TaxID=2587135 RepID=UPI00141EE498|nr:nucleotidyltransferase domain-containing protein [Pedobacter sp. SG908]NII84935.1 putative nucleotidyltransferase [Pedobacter sp. SG908]